MSNLIVQSPAVLTFDGQDYHCAVGRGGISDHKREGDGVTPVGVWALRRLLYRADRLARPPTILSAEALARQDGWCDDPGHADYNRQVRLPHDGRCEQLWREDHVYDLIVVLGHNDDPVVAGAGSAIFLHIATADYAPTAGCVALAEPDLRAVLAGLDQTSRLAVTRQDTEI